MEPALLLLPNLLNKNCDPLIVLPQSVFEAMKNLDGLIAESLQGGRSYLNRFQLKKKTA